VSAPDLFLPHLDWLFMLWMAAFLACCLAIVWLARRRERLRQARHRGADEPARAPTDHDLGPERAEH
jgi:HAMP domain-containing protein